MADIIQLLPDHVANQIAAGEVVQRPASVVKELLENAIDAKATQIKLLIKDAGKTLIQVIDNGLGMSDTDARLSFERHATSKIKTASDLFNLQTKGFRGEALASIAAIAQVELKTKQEKQEIGTILKIEGSKISVQDVISTPKGTSISVKNLFFNIPARRNFLKSNAVETRHIIDEFQRVSLAHPNISFSLLHNDNEIYHLKSDNLRQRIIGIFGDRINDKLVPINEATDLVKITGFVTNPKFAKKKRGEQFFFANNRFIKSNYLNHAVLSAFEGLLANKYYPSYFIFLEVNPSSMDINIHPTKTEIKFENETAIYSIIRATVKHSLGQYSVAPILDFNRDSNLDTPYNYKNKTKKIPNIVVNPNFNPFKKESYKTQTKDWESLYVGTDTLKTNLDTTKIIIESELSQTKLFEVETDKPIVKTYQVQGKYIISTLKNRLLILKQNLAHQRILYEELLTKITIENIGSQQLLLPTEIDFTKPDIAILFEIKEELENIGFQFKEFKSDGIIIDAIPATLPQEKLVETLEEIMNNIKLGVPRNGFSQLDAIIKSMVKSMAIKVGQKLTTKEQEEIIDKLFSCKETNYAPNGKQIFITYSFDEIEKKFN
ncbi:MAG: DNA mismatch repair endonuclease MutL [Flavobacteriaceae bacterium]|nr:DNA mismatch repair endonuclease MutL [Flavobacteriaceae bacterium]